MRKAKTLLRYLHQLLVISALTTVTSVCCREWPSDARAPTSHDVISCRNDGSFSIDTRPDDSFYTQLLPYTALGVTGYVHGFQLCLQQRLEEEIRIEIWRSVTCSTGTCYTLIGHVSVARTADTMVKQYLTRPVRVEASDVLGLSYRRMNPVPHSTFSGCLPSADHMIQHTDFPHIGNEYEFHFDSSTFACKRYRLQAFIEQADSESECQVLQSPENETPYPLLSHESFGTNEYPNNYEECWRVRAANPSDVIVFDTVDFDVELHDTCAFDKLQFYTETVEFTGTGTSQQSCYHTNCEGFCGSYGPSIENSQQWIILRNRTVLRFTSDDAESGRGFYLNYRSINPANYPQLDVTGDPIDWSGVTSTQSVPNAAGAAAQQSTEDDDNDRFWRDWKVWQRTVFVLGVLIASALVIVVVALIVYYGCHLRVCCPPENPNTVKARVGVAEPYVIRKDAMNDQRTFIPYIDDTFARLQGPISPPPKYKKYPEYPGNPPQYKHQRLPPLQAPAYDVTSQTGGHEWEYDTHNTAATVKSKTSYKKTESNSYDEPDIFLPKYLKVNDNTFGAN